MKYLTKWLKSCVNSVKEEEKEEEEEEEEEEEKKQSEIIK